MSGEESDISTVDDDAAEVVSLLDDEYARLLLVLTFEEALATDVLVERLDAAPSTIYDRLSRLADHDLVTEHQEIDPDGHHRKTYQACLDQVSMSLSGDGFEVRINRAPADPADRLTDAFDDLRQ